MIHIMIIYSLCFLNFILIGICDAAGRNPLIYKRKYYYKSILHSIAVGHVLLAVVAVYSWTLWWNSTDADILWESFLAVSMMPIQLFVTYASIVLCTFLLYAIPNSELRSFVTVASFGPLTMMKAWIFIIGWFTFVSSTSDWRLISIWSLGTSAILFQKKLLNSLGFAHRLTYPQSLQFTENS
ncbi:hypothetical protein [Candidatus Uabimicrobium amorphum]|uniref:Uncharacterized protein n=1 Tax=Uabimicrobium amorphum TaxID=2596890 RepID=A0A5S9F5B1_UABAM|nr:hypothetical protein [Candidatus Uabimicrobium amorphum]BBM85479.1 hypothetical protein UABAM_03848 [Candidatus Uabimicrobium amorphum]